MRQRLSTMTWRRRLLLSLALALAVSAIAFGAVRYTASREQQRIAISDLTQRVRAGEVASISVSGDGGVATMHSGEALSFYTGAGKNSVLTALTRFGATPEELAQVTFVVTDPPPRWLDTLLVIVPFVFLAGLVLFLWRRSGSQGGGNPLQAFGRSRARVSSPNQVVITFADVAGVEEPCLELQEIVEFLKEPARFTALGARIPRGVLLVGPPGTGKTLLARAVAGEGGVPFFSISGAEFVEMFVGVGASRVRDLFDKAKKSAPCIVFVDEVDAVGRQRGAGLGHANDEREQTLNQILVEMDGFDDHAGVIVIAATNRPDVLDPALLRPGRFDRVVVVPAPDVRGRRAILDVHARGKPFEPGVAMDVLAKQTHGFSGADLANVLNEGAILAARRDKKAIGMAELEEAIDRVNAGPERKSHVMSSREKERTAYYESGHAIVATFLEHHDPVHKISIVPRGLRISYTRYLPPEDRLYMTRSQFRDAVTAILSGHAAEAVVFGEMSSTAGEDIARATAIVRRMVKEFGMSERLGPVSFGHKHQMVFLGRDIGEQRDYSQHVAELIDDEVHRLVTEGHARATAILNQHRELLDRLAHALMGQESLDAPALELILKPA
jgi:cell division protease FtsH